MIPIFSSSIMALATAAVLVCSPQSELDVKQLEIHEKGAHYRIDIEYPEIAGAHQFNEAVRKNVESMTTTFKRDMPEGTMPKEFADGELSGRFLATKLKNGVVSVLLEYSVYTPGAAHPGGVIASINYDSRTGSMVKLSDLFRPGVNYLKHLSKLAIASLDQNEFADHDAIRRGAGPVESNFRVFTLTDTSLVLHFAQYQVAAGPMGEPSVAIPLEKLAPILRKL